MPAAQRGASPGSRMALCTQAASSHGSSDGAAQHSRQRVSTNRALGCTPCSSVAAGPGFGQSTHTSASGNCSSSCRSQPAVISSSP